MLRTRSFAGLLGLAACLAASGRASTIQRLSFDELIDRSGVIVSGTVTRAWTDWGSSHRYIWTHYELSVRGAQKGTPGAIVTISEPGGVIDGHGFAVGGAVAYRPGENVLVFLNRVPNGYWRTTGWGQGKYKIDANGRIRPGALLLDVEAASNSTATPPNGASILDGLTLEQAAARIAAHLHSAHGSPQ